MSGDLLIAAPLRIEARGLRAGTRTARVLRTGMGPSRSRRSAKRLAADPAARLAVAGFAGALDERVLPGDVVIATRLAEESEARVVTPNTPGRSGLAGCLEAQGFRVHSGPIVSMPEVVKGAARGELASQGFIAVDMESAWLAEGARERPLAVVRIAIDGPNHEIARPAFVPRLARAYRGLARVAHCLEDWLSGEDE